jgi:hypothetical protein
LNVPTENQGASTVNPAPRVNGKPWARPGRNRGIKTKTACACRLYQVKPARPADSAAIAIENTPRELSGPFMHFAMSYSRANEAAPFAAATAAQLGLVCFNPQTGSLWR